MKREALDALQTLPMEQLIAGLGSGFQTSPVVDGASLPQHVFDPVATAISANIPLLIGSTETEVTWSVNTDYTPIETDDALRARIARALRSDADAAGKVDGDLQSRPPECQPARSRAHRRDRCVEFPQGHRSRGRAQGSSRPGARLHVSLPVVLAGERRPAARDALHGDSVRVQHARHDAVDHRRRRGPASAVGRHERRVGAFARSGNPNHPGIPRWEPFTQSARHTMMFNPRNAAALRRSVPLTEREALAAARAR